jgi:thymidylate synthase
MKLELTTNERTILDLLVVLDNKRKKGDIVAGTVEQLGVHIPMMPQDPPIRLGTIKKPAHKYIEKELEWYLSLDRNITGHVDDVEIWKKIATDDGRVNSNYGWCVFSSENGDGKKSQYQFAMDQLFAHPDGRQSVIFYSRPSMQWEWNDNKNAKHDFMCTFQTIHHIRHDELIYTVIQRSGDLVFGILNDLCWHQYVYNKMYVELRERFPNLKVGIINYYISSAHVYERHFDLLEKVVAEYEQSKLG